MIAKSKEGEDHLVNLKRLFGHLEKYKIRLNPAKCTFSVKSGKLLGFVVSEKGIEVDPDKVKAIMELPPPSTVRESILHEEHSKWRCQLTEYDIEYVSRTSVKGQAIANHLAKFPVDDDPPINSDFPDEEILQVNDEEKTLGWKMYFDGAVNSIGSGIGAVLISPEGRHFPIAAKINFPCTNNTSSTCCKPANSLPLLIAMTEELSDVLQRTFSLVARLSTTVHLMPYYYSVSTRMRHNASWKKCKREIADHT
ncbi:hypothetical protein CRG98_012795 [Punica granatum]|uniref:RNase H type-1 domain-containing protein n=1 Tax=Punica granatum TaxID=22663 RepID=A0A2I0KE50_PUNGR|nr:hypothetical protein CRG98_012795 [Punica granatum]